MSEEKERIKDIIRVMRDETFWMNGQRVPSVEEYMEKYALRLEIALSGMGDALTATWEALDTARGYAMQIEDKTGEADVWDDAGEIVEEIDRAKRILRGVLV